MRSTERKMIDETNGSRDIQAGENSEGPQKDGKRGGKVRQKRRKRRQQKKKTCPWTQEINGRVIGSCWGCRQSCNMLNRKDIGKNSKYNVCISF